MADALKSIGTLFILGGVYLLWVGFTLEPTVTLPDQEPVANVQLLQVQAVDILLGAAAIIQGTVCMVGGFLLSRLSARA